METAVRERPRQAGFLGDQAWVRFSARAWASAREARLLAVLVLVGYGLRALRLQFQPLWWDEGYSVWFATHNLREMAALTAADIHPPLYYALLRGWITVLGTGPVALRLFSVVTGVAAIPLLYLLGRRLAGRRVALWAALLLAINPLHIYYSQEVRMYGLVALLATGSMLAAWGMLGENHASGLDHDDAKIGGGREARRTRSRSRLSLDPRGRQRDVGTLAERGRHATSVTYGSLAVGSSFVLRASVVQAVLPYWGRHAASVTYVLLTTAALYTQYYAAFLPVGLTLYAIVRWRREGKKLAQWMGAQFAVLLFYLPWLVYAGPKLIAYVGDKVRQDADLPLGPFAYLGRHLSAFLVGHLEGPLAPFWPLALALLIPLLAGAWLLWKKRSVRSPALAVPGTVLLAVLLMGYAVNLRYPFSPVHGERLMLLGLPSFLLLAATGLDGLWQTRRSVGIGALGLSVMMAGSSLLAFYTVPRYPGNDYRDLIAQTVEQGAPGDTVFCVYPWQAGYWRSYGIASGPIAVLTPSPAWNTEVADSLDAALARGHVWFPAHLSAGRFLEREIERHLGKQALPFVNQWYGPGTRLSGWAARTGDLRSVQAPPVRFIVPGQDEAMVTLATVRASGMPVAAANAVAPLSLTWQGAAPPPAMAASVRLVDALGQIWAQHDYAPVGNTETTTRSSTAGWEAQDELGLLVPAGTPPGRYTVEVEVRTTPDDRPLEARTVGSDGTSSRPTDLKSVNLFEIDVTPATVTLGRERLPIANPAEVALGENLRFLGHSMDQGIVAPGQLRRVTLFWQSEDVPGADYVAFLQILTKTGEAIPVWEAPPGAGYPSSRWTAGTLMRTQASFRVPASLADGRYTLITGLFRATDGERLRNQHGEDFVRLEEIVVRGRPRLTQAPETAYRTGILFGEEMLLVGYDLANETSYSAGSTFPITLTWQAVATPERAYTVFIHLLDAKGESHGFGDSEPGRGAYPTTSWSPGEYLVDRHEVAVSPAAPAGTYRLAVGFYDPITGERATTADGQDRAVLEQAVRIGASQP